MAIEILIERMMNDRELDGGYMDRMSTRGKKWPSWKMAR